MINLDNLDKFIKYYFIGLGILIVVALLCYISIYRDTSECQVELGNISYWEEEEDLKNYNIEEEYYNKNLTGFSATIIYGGGGEQIQERVFTVFINASGTLKSYNVNSLGLLSDAKKEYKEGNEYIFTICNETLRGITKYDWSNKNFYYRFKEKI